MKKSSKILVLIITLLPYVSMAITLVSVAKLILTGDPEQLEYFYLERELTILWLVAMLTFYFVHIFTKSRLTKQVRILWAVLVVLFNMFIMPVYWFLYVWPEEPAPAKQPLAS